MREYKGDRGYLTFALGKGYVKHAAAQAMSIKLTQKQVTACAVVVDDIAAAEITDDQRRLFDEIIPVSYKAVGWDMSQECNAWPLTPWRETIKTDADMLFTSSIDHWWQHLQTRGMCITSCIRDFRGNVITSRRHRQLFDENLLPNVYSALTYFNQSEIAYQFFSAARGATIDWPWIAKQHLIKNDDPTLRTDELFAISARIVGEEHVTWPAAFPAFVHMKEEINNLSTSKPWHKQLPCYWENKKFFVGNHQQSLPFHYHHKELLDAGLYESIKRDYRKLVESIQ